MAKTYFFREYFKKENITQDNLTFCEYEAEELHNFIDANYIVFSSLTPFSIEFNSGNKTWDREIKYSLDNRETWVTWNGERIYAERYYGDNYKIYLRGHNNTYISSTSSNDNFKGFSLYGSNIECRGNINALLDYENATTASMSNFCFLNLFKDCTNLTVAPDIKTTAPVLDGSYYGVFSGCTNLKTPPAISASNLQGTYCFNAMFYNCTSLATIPSLPATTLRQYCYNSMFYCCSSIRFSSSKTGDYQNAYRIPISGTGTTGVTGTRAVSGMIMSTGGSISNVSVNNTYYVANKIKKPDGTITPYSKIYINISNGTYSGDTAIGESGIATLTLTPDTYYALPTSITVEGAQFSYNNSTGVVTFSNPTSDIVTLSAVFKYNDAFLEFTSASPFTLSTNNSTKNWDGTLEYSLNKTSWTTWTGTSVISSSNDGKLYVRGSGNSRITGKESSSDNNVSKKFWCFDGNDDINCKGNIESLLDYRNVLDGIHPSMDSYCFAYLFYYASDAATKTLLTAPDLPAEDLKDYCYEYMFSGTSITTAPILPATIMKNYCYHYMFNNCSSLINIQSTLPAEVLASYCYSYMFSNCTSLTTPPELPAATLKNDCYEHMFAGCSQLACAPILQSRKLASYCYEYMFDGCISLLSAPELPATTLENYCYRYMFNNCTSLAAAPKLPSKKLASGCYKGIFCGCSSLTTLPELMATVLAGSCYCEMFKNCKSIASAPVLPATILAGQCYDNMFCGCTSLTLPPALPATILAERCYYNMFYGCTSLQSVPALPATELAMQCYSHMFYNCKAITTVPSDLLPAMVMIEPGKNILGGYVSGCYDSMFYGCSSLTVAPNLPATTLARNCYRYMFASSGIVNTPQLPATVMKESCYRSMFQGCSNLEDIFYSFDAITLEKECWRGMFYNCKKLGAADVTDHTSDASTIEGAPTRYGLPKVFEFNAEELAEGCFYDMFYGCENLRRTPVMKGKVLADGCYRGMFMGCKRLGEALNSCNNNLFSFNNNATQLAADCYRDMFKGCSSITSLPNSLPITTLASNCYDTMFHGTSITSIPNGFLPATTLAPYCYEYMFANCTSLISVPSNLLPATDLTGADGCYKAMFSGSSTGSGFLGLGAIYVKLPVAPNLPATTLSSECYYSMFSYNNALTSAPALPATELKVLCYYRMFRNCTALQTAPKLPATTLADGCYDQMFYSCSSLYVSDSPISGTAETAWNIPESSVIAETTSSQSGMFSSCKGTRSSNDFPGTSGSRFTYYTQNQPV